MYNIAFTADLDSPFSFTSKRNKPIDLHGRTKLRTSTNPLPPIVHRCLQGRSRDGASTTRFKLTCQEFIDPVAYKSPLISKAPPQKKKPSQLLHKSQHPTSQSHHHYPASIPPSTSTTLPSRQTDQNTKKPSLCQFPEFIRLYSLQTR